MNTKGNEHSNKKRKYGIHSISIFFHAFLSCRFPIFQCSYFNFSSVFLWRLGPTRHQGVARLLVMPGCSQESICAECLVAIRGDRLCVVPGWKKDGGAQFGGAPRVNQ